tara:strand:+ start:250 stop:744 length:495 start_codon:yes stop_codon:yes gene_type:complete
MLSSIVIEHISTYLEYEQQFDIIYICKNIYGSTLYIKKQKILKEENYKHILLNSLNNNYDTFYKYLKIYNDKTFIDSLLYKAIDEIPSVWKNVLRYSYYDLRYICELIYHGACIHETKLNVDNILYYYVFHDSLMTCKTLNRKRFLNNIKNNILLEELHNKLRE